MRKQKRTARDMVKEEYLHACAVGSAANVGALLPQVKDDGPLLSHSVEKVCARADWDTAEDVLDTILGLCDAVAVPDAALHTAAQFSSRNILSKLILHKKIKDAHLLGRLLVSCCKRHDNNH